jgi:hypothetical protein
LLKYWNLSPKWVEGNGHWQYSGALSSALLNGEYYVS